MEFTVKKAGMLTTVQDLGRWGFQSSGVPVAGAMDTNALRLGNIMVGNEPGAAALEVTFMGPEILVSGSGYAAFTGADLGFSLNGAEVGSWKVVALKDGDVISFKGPKVGCRGYICVAGGIDVPVVMNSRSTYTRAKIGGYEGRALKVGDVLKTCKQTAELKNLGGFAIPAEMRPNYASNAPLKILTGLQEDMFTEEGLKTLFSSEYVLTSESDRMGCRFEGPKVEHKSGADIVSDAIPLGSVQIPGHGMPITMLADRQTTGGYTKVGVLTQSSIAALVQKMPGSKVRFERGDANEAKAELRKAIEREEEVAKLRDAWRLELSSAQGLARSLRITINGKSYDVTCEEIK